MFDTKQLRDVDIQFIDGDRGKNYPNGDDFSEDGYCLFLNAKNVTQVGFSFANCIYINKEKDEQLRQGKLKRFDSVLTTRGTVGNVAYYDIDVPFENIRINSGMVIVRPNCNLFNPEFVFWTLKSYLIQNQIKLLTTGSAQPQLPISAIVSMDFPILPMTAQNNIVRIIGTLQKKIALNQKINANLQAQAAAVFCDSFKGCADGTLSDICEYSTDRVAVSELNLDNYFSTENMLPDKQGVSQASGLPTTAQTPRCSVGDVLVSNIRPYFKKIYYCHEDGGCSADVLCFRPKHEELSAFLFYALYDDSFFDFMMAGSKGTKMPRGDRKQIMTYPIAMPSDEELASFNALARPMIETIKTNAQVSKHLAAIRDALLPRLMSGEIDVSGIELG